MTYTLKTNKILLQEIRDDINMQKDKSCSRIQKLYIVNIVDFSGCNP